MFWILLIISCFFPPFWFVFAGYLIYMAFKAYIRQLGINTHASNLFLLRTITEMVKSGRSSKTLYNISMPYIETFAEIYGTQTAVMSQTNTVTCLLNVYNENYFVHLQHNGINTLQITIMELEEYKRKLHEKFIE